MSILTQLNTYFSGEGHNYSFSRYYAQIYCAEESIRLESDLAKALVLVFLLGNFERHVNENLKEWTFTDLILCII